MWGWGRKPKEDPNPPAKKPTNNTKKQSPVQSTKNNTTQTPVQPSKKLPIIENAIIPPTASDINPTNFDQIQSQLQEEYERKIRVLSQCLEEKAEENITLFEEKQKIERKLAHFQKEAESAKDLELVVSELNSMLRTKDEEFESLKVELQQKDKERGELLKLNEEFQRRIRVLSTCLDEMAQENLGYWKHPPEPANKGVQQSGNPSAKPSNQPNQPSAPSSKPSDLYHESPSQSLAATGSVEAKLIEVTLRQDLERALEEKTTLEKELEKAKEELNQAEQKLQAKEKRIVQLNTKLMDAVNKKTSYQDSNELYEQKLKSLEKELMDNLHQEGIRRQEAEYVASKLKKKVAELQFLLDERDQDSDSSYYSEDDDLD